MDKQLKKITSSGIAFLTLLTEKKASFYYALCDAVGRGTSLQAGRSLV
jgi:hypothetical protein